MGGWPWEFEDPSELDKWGLVAFTCSIEERSLLCQLGILRIPFLYSDGILSMGQIGVQDVIPQVVPT